MTTTTVLSDESKAGTSSKYSQAEDKTSVRIRFVFKFDTGYKTSATFRSEPHLACEELKLAKHKLFLTKITVLAGLRHKQQKLQPSNDDRFV